MDVLKEFEQYLPTWCEKQLVPLPTQGSEKWNLAWYDFVKERLNPNWEKIAQSYRDMELLTKEQKEQQNIEHELNQIIEEPKEQEQKEQQTNEDSNNEWEKVQQILKKLK